MKGRRIAFVDANFCWPPNGGADADVFHVLSRLAGLGAEVRLFVIHEEGSTERGLVTQPPDAFRTTVIDVDQTGLRPAALCPKVRAAVDGFHPQAVFLTHAFALKPYLAGVLSHYPLVGRFYAHELACMKDATRFKDGAHCLNDFLRTPEVCRACGFAHLTPELRRDGRSAWLSDYRAAEAWRPEYHQIVLDSLACYHSVVVSNTTLKAHLEGFHNRVRVIPGGAPVNGIPCEREPGYEPGKKIILMTGRAEDPLKGLGVLLRAGQLLAERRPARDFEIWATHFDVMLDSPLLRPLGWLTHEETLALYGQADIVAVPSLWQEPFGLVAVEAMAAGAPVAASRSGGLADIVRDGETGFLCAPHDAADLAEKLGRLLDDAPLRYRLGMGGRRVAASEYDWDAVINRHYAPLIGELTQ